MDGPYADHLLDARDVCSNCFQLVRIERVDPVMYREGFSDDLDAKLSRRKRTTTREYHDSDPNPTQCKVTFCECGIEGTSERLWDPTDLSRERFKDLLRAGVETLEHKGVSLDRARKRETLAYALQSFDDSGDADRAFAEALRWE
jgi:hypothetical protein